MRFKFCKHFTSSKATGEKAKQLYCDHAYGLCEETKCCNNCEVEGNCRCRYSNKPGGEMKDKKAVGSRKSEVGGQQKNADKSLSIYSNNLSYDRDRIIEETNFLLKHKVITEFEIGKRLIVIRDQEGATTWSQIIEEHFPGLHIRQAQRYMLFSRKVDQLPKIKDFAEGAGNFRKCLELISSFDEADLAALDCGDSVSGVTLDDVDKMSFRELKENLRKEKYKNAQGCDQLIELEKENEKLSKAITEARNPPQLSDQDIFKELFNIRIKLGGLLLGLEYVDMSKSAAVCNEFLGTLEWFRREVNIAVLEGNNRALQVATELNLTDLDLVAGIEWDKWTGDGQGAQVRDLNHDPADHQAPEIIPTIEEALANAERRS